MEEPNDATKTYLLQQLRVKWINTNYQASQEGHIAQVLDDPQMKAQAVATMKRAMTAVDEIDKALLELEQPSDAKAV